MEAKARRLCDAGLPQAPEGTRPLSQKPMFLLGKTTIFADLPRFKKWCGREDSNLHGIATASPSSWCVCQFRHCRTCVAQFILAASTVTRNQFNSACATSLGEQAAPVLVAAAPALQESASPVQGLLPPE